MMAERSNREGLYWRVVVEANGPPCPGLVSRVVWGLTHGQGRERATERAAAV